MFSGRRALVMLKYRNQFRICIYDVSKTFVLYKQSSTHFADIAIIVKIHIANEKCIHTSFYDIQRT